MLCYVMLYTVSTLCNHNFISVRHSLRPPTYILSQQSYFKMIKLHVTVLVLVRPDDCLQPLHISAY